MLEHTHKHTIDENIRNELRDGTDLTECENMPMITIMSYVINKALIRKRIIGSEQAHY